jgi:HEAT repeats
VKKLFLFFLLIFLTASTLSAHVVEARFTTAKTNFLVGEPIFVVLTLSNRGDNTVWVNLKAPADLEPQCHDFAMQVPGAEPARAWGCGFSISCGRGSHEISPGDSLTLRQLLNSEVRLQHLGSFAIHTRTTIEVLDQDSFTDRSIDEFEVSDTLSVNLQTGEENQLRAAFQPFVAELAGPQGPKRWEAAEAIIEMAPPFLEDVLIELTTSRHAYAAIGALGKINSLKAREVLASIARVNDDPGLRAEAIRTLGQAKDESYLPLLLQLAQSTDRADQINAAQAAGNLGGPAAVPPLAVLLSSPDRETRENITSGLGRTHAPQAVPILIGMLLDSDVRVRQNAVIGLGSLTHRAALDSGQWANVESLQSAGAVHQRWVRWWHSNGDSKVYSGSDCAPPESID